MGFKAPKSEKLYFSISEVAEKFNLAPSALRFWEKEFDMINPKKNKKGTRHYTLKDIEVIGKIYTLVKEKGYTLDGAKKFIKSKEVLPIEVPVILTPNIPILDIIKKLESIKVKLMDLERGI